MAQAVTFGQRFGYGQEWLRDGWRRFLPARFSALVIIVAGIVYLLTPMGPDFIVSVATADDAGFRTIFVLAVLWWALNAWYWARIAVLVVPANPSPPARYQVDDWTTQADRQRILNIFWPRAMGALAVLVVVAAFVRAAWGAPWKIVYDVAWLGGIVLAIAIPFLWLVFHRRLAARWAIRSLGLALPGGRQGVSETPPPPRLRPRRLSEIFRDPWVFVPAGAMQALQLYLLYLSIVAPIETGQWLGPNAVIFLATAGWTCGLGLIGLIGDRMRVPVLSLLLIYGAVVSCTGNENHAIRLVDEAPKLRPLDTALTDWQAQAGNGAPMVLVASAGGASRAAYWTTNVLGHLMDDPAFDFRRHLFSMSGVSGGGLGLSVTAALLAEYPGGDDKRLLPECGDPAIEAHADGYLNCGRAVLRRDFLSPLLMAALYRDGMQRFVPFATPFESRATALEQSWEQAWKIYGARTGSTGSGRMAAAMGGLQAAGGWQPVLMINGTSTITGRRIITTDLDLDPSAQRPGDFAAASGFAGLTQDATTQRLRDLRLSTAAHNGARFPFFSPGGLIDARGPAVASAYVLDGKQNEGQSFRDRVVDGGYFENFGAASTLDLIEALARRTGGAGQPARPKLVVIQVSADPELFDDRHAERCGRSGRWQEGDPYTDFEERPVPKPVGRGGYEVKTPVLALAASRTGRGVEAMYRLRARVEEMGGTFVHFRLTWQGPDLDPPLNWVLSDDARTRIDAHWPGERGRTAANCFNTQEYLRLRAALVQW